MKKLNLSVASAVLYLLAHPVGAIDLHTFPILPASPTNIVAEGLGNAGVADGTLFNATAWNPALITQAPRTLELLQLGLNIGNDAFSVYDYVQAGNFPEPDKTFYDLVSGSTSQINSGLTSLDDFATHMLNKSLQAGAGDNLSVKIGAVGVQVFSNVRAVAQAKAGPLISQLTSIPLPYTIASSGQLNAAVGIMQNSIDAAVSQTLTASQQSAIASETTAYKNGSEDLNTYAQNSVSILYSGDPTIDQQALQDKLIKNIVGNLADDLVYTNALAYGDIVGMVTTGFDVAPNLTMGLNFKVVQRYFAWDTLSVGSILHSDSAQGKDFVENLKQSSSRVGVDVGFLYKLDAGLNAGLSFQDLIKASLNKPTFSSGSAMEGMLSDSAPLVTRLGISWHPINEVSLNADVDDLFSTTSYYTNYDLFSHFRFGTALTLAGILQLRGGFANNNLAGGAGVMFGFLGVDYSYAMDDLSQSYNHYAQLRLAF